MTDPSTLLSEMDLPDGVVEKTAKALFERQPTLNYWANVNELVKQPWRRDAKTAIRAALQALVDCGRAEIVNATDASFTKGKHAVLCIPIRLSPQRKEKEQT